MYYFVGIKGTGMSALACILKDNGYEVAGSDLEKHFFTEEPLRERNIPIYSFDQNNIKDGMTVIIGNAFADDFPEAKAALDNPSCKCYRYHYFLGELMNKYHGISIAGSHGKTTTTGMMTAMLSYDHPVGYLIGDGTGHISKDAEDFIVESDEFRRHFLAYHPEYAIITNMDWDHVDYFKTNEDYIYSYQQFVKQVKTAVVAWGEDPFTRGLKAEVPIYYYGVEANDDFLAYNIVETPVDMSFDVKFKGEYKGSYHLPFVGRHLLLNSLGVIAVGLLKGLKPEDIEAGLAGFKGVKRRFKVEVMGDNIFVDDYAHHPTEVNVTLKAAKMRYPDKKIVAVFKPHRAGRLYHFAKDFADALKQADVVGLCEFTSIDDHDDGVDIDINYLANFIENSLVFHETSEDAKVLADLAPCVYVFMSSKDIYPFKNKVVEILKNR